MFGFFCFSFGNRFCINVSCCGVLRWPKNVSFSSRLCPVSHAFGFVLALCFPCAQTHSCAPRQKKLTRLYVWASFSFFWWKRFGINISFFWKPARHPRSLAENHIGWYHHVKKHAERPTPVRTNSWEKQTHDKPPPLWLPPPPPQNNVVLTPGPILEEAKTARTTTATLHTRQ